MGRLTGKVAVVTGASRGVGKGIALALASEGATVYVTGRTVAEGQHVLPGFVGAGADAASATICSCAGALATSAGAASSGGTTSFCGFFLPAAIEAADASADMADNSPLS